MKIQKERLGFRFLVVFVCFFVSFLLTAESVSAISGVLAAILNYEFALEDQRNML